MDKVIKNAKLLCKYLISAVSVATLAVAGAAAMQAPAEATEPQTKVETSTPADTVSPIVCNKFPQPPLPRGVEGDSNCSVKKTNWYEQEWPSVAEIETDPHVAVTPAAENTAATPATPAGNSPAPANSAILEPIDEYNLDGEPMARVTSVSQLRDVHPTDWVFQALQSLVERYGCIAGYPAPAALGRQHQTFRGNRTLTRWEFAAGLNACMEQIERLIAESEAVVRSDIEKLQRLAQEFEAELAALDARVDNLEGRVAFLEDYQFSTTTKLSGRLIFSPKDTFSGRGDTQTVLQYQTLLRLLTSFTGRDLLSVGLIASNSNLAQLAPTNDGKIVGPTSEGSTIWAFGGGTRNSFRLTTLEYIFPIIDNQDKLYLTLIASNGFNTSRSLLPITNLSWEGYELGSGPTSAFAQRSPLYRLGGGQGVIANYDSGPWRLTLGYLAIRGSNPSRGEGLFNGDYLALGQLNFTPSDRFSLALTYRNNYFGPGRFAFNNRFQARGADSPGFLGTALANRFDNEGVFFDENIPVVSNTYGVQGYYQVSPKLVIGGFAAKFNARLIGRGDADIWSYAVNLTFPDLGKEGNLGGLIVGVEPTLTGLRIGDNFVGGFKRDTSLHIEGFYQYRLTDKISITPAFIWITAPNQDADNEDIVVGLIRTTFRF